jgi:hypothetical protein
VSDQLPTRQMIFDVAGDLFTHGRQLKQLGFDNRIIGLLGKLPILGRFVPQIVRPIHAAQYRLRGRRSKQGGVHARQRVAAPIDGRVVSHGEFDDF